MDIIRAGFGGAARLGLGCNSLGTVPDEAARLLVGAACDCGIAVFDTAAAYAGGRSEATLGQLLPRDRSGLFVITKFGHPQEAGRAGPPGGAANVRASAESSLRRLRAERLDCLVMHFPDPATPIAETLEALQRLIEQGKIASWGLSNVTPVGLAQAVGAARELGMPAPGLVQEEYNLLNRVKAEALLPVLLRETIPLTPFFPLASGLLTGKYRHGLPADSLRSQVVRNFHERFLQPAMLERLEPLHALADSTGIGLAAIALQWLRARPGVAAITVGASSAAQLRDNVAAWTRLVPDAVLTAAGALSESCSGNENNT